MRLRSWSRRMLDIVAMLSPLVLLFSLFRLETMLPHSSTVLEFHMALAVKVYHDSSINRINQFARHEAFLIPRAERHSYSVASTSRKEPVHGLRYGIATFSSKVHTDVSHRSPTELGLFGSLLGWFSDKLAGRWYVPPMPIGERSSDILKNYGPLQTEKETQEFFKLIGAHSNASMVEIGKAYENALATLPDDSHEDVRELFSEFLRKEFVRAFEHMESFMDRGQEAWEEFWDPSKDAFGNPVTNEFGSPEEEDKVMMSRLPKQFDATKFREYWRKNSRKFNTLLNKVDMPSRVRMTSDFTGRLAKCSSTMLPVLVLGMFPQFTSLSMAIQGILASGFIFKGDREMLLEKEKKSGESIHTGATKTTTASSKTLLTSMVLCAHGLLGVGMCKLLSQYTSVLEHLTPQILKTACINLQFYIAALMYDTSDLTPYGHMRREQKRLEKLTDTVTDIL